MSFESNNRSNEPETWEVDLDPIQRAGIILLVLAVLFSSIGSFVSPHDISGKPVLLLPEVRQMESYRRASLKWIANFQALDGQIATIRGNSTSDLFSQSRQAQAALQFAVQLVQDIDQMTYPPSAVNLHDDLVSTAVAYLESARAMIVWVGAPEDARRSQMDEALKQARENLKALEKSKWLVTY